MCRIEVSVNLRREMTTRVNVSTRNRQMPTSEVAEGFVWVETPAGRVLTAEALTRHARHAFTTRDFGASPTAGTDSLGALAGFLDVEQNQHRPCAAGARLRRDRRSRRPRACSRDRRPMRWCRPTPRGRSPSPSRTACPCSLPTVGAEPSRPSMPDGAAPRHAWSSPRCRRSSRGRAAVRPRGGYRPEHRPVLLSSGCARAGCLAAGLASCRRMVHAGWRRALAARPLARQRPPTHRGRRFPRRNPCGSLLHGGSPGRLFFLPERGSCGRADVWSD